MISQSGYINLCNHQQWEIMLLQIIPNTNYFYLLKY